MTITHTPQDFAEAEFARHPDGRIAARIGVGVAWYGRLSADQEYLVWRPDELMASEGWAPVAETLPDWGALTTHLMKRHEVEQERDQARAELAQRTVERDELQRAWDRRGITEPRPLTPDDMEAVHRAGESLAKTTGFTFTPAMIRDALAAAVTEPPARPEGAEVIEAMVADQVGGDVPPATIRAIADHLAEHGVRPAWGGGAR